MQVFVVILLLVSLATAALGKTPFQKEASSKVVQPTAPVIRLPPLNTRTENDAVKAEQIRKKRKGHRGMRFEAFTSNVMRGMLEVINFHDKAAKAVNATVEKAKTASMRANENPADLGKTAAQAAATGAGIAFAAAASPVEIVAGATAAAAMGVASAVLTWREEAAVKKLTKATTKTEIEKDLFEVMRPIADKAGRAIRPAFSLAVGKASPVIAHAAASLPVPLVETDVSEENAEPIKIIPPVRDFQVSDHQQKKDLAYLPRYARRYQGQSAQTTEIQVEVPSREGATSPTTISSLTSPAVIGAQTQAEDDSKQKTRPSASLVKYAPSYHRQPHTEVPTGANAAETSLELSGLPSYPSYHRQSTLAVAPISVDTIQGAALKSIVDEKLKALEKHQHRRQRKSAYWGKYGRGFHAQSGHAAEIQPNVTKPNEALENAEPHGIAQFKKFLRAKYARRYHRQLGQTTSVKAELPFSDDASRVSLNTLPSPTSPTIVNTISTASTEADAVEAVKKQATWTSAFWSRFAPRYHGRLAENAAVHSALPIDARQVVSNPTAISSPSSPAVINTHAADSTKTGAVLGARRQPKRKSAFWQRFAPNYHGRHSQTTDVMVEVPLRINTIATSPTTMSSRTSPAVISTPPASSADSDVVEVAQKQSKGKSAFWRRFARSYHGQAARVVEPIDVNSVATSPASLSLPTSPAIISTLAQTEDTKQKSRPSSSPARYAPSYHWQPGQMSDAEVEVPIDVNAEKASPSTALVSNTAQVEGSKETHRRSASPARYAASYHRQPGQMLDAQVEVQIGADTKATPPAMVSSPSPRAIISALDQVEIPKANNRKASSTARYTPSYHRRPGQTSNAHVEFPMDVEASKQTNRGSFLPARYAPSYHRRPGQTDVQVDVPIDTNPNQFANSPITLPSPTSPAVVRNQVQPDASMQQFEAALTQIDAAQAEALKAFLDDAESVQVFKRAVKVLETAEATGDVDFMRLLRKVVVGDESKPIHENTQCVKAWLSKLTHMISEDERHQICDNVGLQKEDEQRGSQKPRRKAIRYQRTPMRNVFAATPSILTVPSALIVLAGASVICAIFRFRRGLSRMSPEVFLATDELC